ncbi:hypothetical protein [Streptomyces nanshensis]|uniref:Uncharacterized protein n=1 Tax=Streptomyces nanshensis TaxID=518642 RepID=A0A1E7LAM1_9ACTN|nr:hypothetical protein [Streptomyces nanshensis]OEV13292.1 hypothetical protein AN218_04220 [Streptomyces nanshensis]
MSQEWETLADAVATVHAELDGRYFEVFEQLALDAGLFAYCSCGRRVYAGEPRCAGCGRDSAPAQPGGVQDLPLSGHHHREGERS